jgi:hypothetical protein
MHAAAAPRRIIRRLDIQKSLSRVIKRSVIRLPAALKTAFATSWTPRADGAALAMPLDFQYLIENANPR